MNKILFLHGFFASGSCIPANAMRKAFEDRAVVLTPDIPIHPLKAMELITCMCRSEHPDIIVGNSNGAFLAQMAAQITETPALLGNPHLEMTKFLSMRIGTHRFKSQRADGIQDFVIDNALISEYRMVQQRQFDVFHEDLKDKIWGLFGEKDTLAGYESLFLKHYLKAFHFPGAHTPTAEEVLKYYVPLTERLMMHNKK